MTRLIFLISTLTQIVHIHVRSAKSATADCQCINYDSTYEKKYGIFMSPDWPKYYASNINCMLYTFTSSTDSIIEVVFDEFDLDRSSIDCIYGDYVKLYLHLKEPEVNERSMHNSVLCGKLSDIQQTHYSAGSALIFEFHTDWRSGNNTGFRGTFRFINKTLFEINGKLTPGTNCNYTFYSESTNENSGRFFSPQYPSAYPRGVDCAYRFVGNKNERVRLIFEQVKLQKSELSCLNNPDKIEVRDGDDAHSPVIGQLCNKNTLVDMVSTGPNLHVLFQSRGHFPGQGFKASFIFEDVSLYNLNSETPSMEPEKTSIEQRLTTPKESTTHCLDGLQD